MVVSNVVQRMNKEELGFGVVEAKGLVLLPPPLFF